MDCQFRVGAGIRRPVSEKGAPILNLSFRASEQLLNRARSGEPGNANDYMDEVFKKKYQLIFFSKQYLLSFVFTV